MITHGNSVPPEQRSETKTDDFPNSTDRPNHQMHFVLTGNTSFKIANFREALIRDLLSSGHRVTAVAPRDEYTAKLLDLGCNFVELSVSRSGTSLHKELMVIWRLYRIFRKAKPDVVFSYTIKNNLYGALAAKRLRIPFIPNVTGLGTVFSGHGLTNSVVQRLYRVSFRGLPIVFVQNEGDLGAIAASGMAPHSVLRLLPGSGVNLDQFFPCPLPSGKGDCVFLLMARLLSEKGVYEYVEAARRLSAEFPGTRFKLLGPVDTDSRVGIGPGVLETWMKEGAITYLGVTQDVAADIAGADCIVLPSYYKEGTPRALLEGAAMARPLITTDTQGCRSTLEDGVTGFLCKARDADDLTEKMRCMILLGPAKREEMGRRGRERMETLFDEQIVVNAYKRAANEVAASEDA